MDTYPNAHERRYRSKQALPFYLQMKVNKQFLCNLHEKNDFLLQMTFI